jgi:ribosome assembly protein 4
VNLPEDKNASPGAPTRVVISKSLEADVLDHPTGDFTPEDIIVVHCLPQSVFCVRLATTYKMLLHALWSVILSFH